MASILQQPGTPTLGVLLNDPAMQFRIPIYQRDYAWEADQIDDFVADMYPFSMSGTEHFFGTIVLTDSHPGPTYTGPDSVRYVIDGQQRLTTSLLTIVVLRHLLLEISELNFPSVRDTAIKFQTFLTVGQPFDNRPRIFANRGNQDFLTALLDGSTESLRDVETAYASLPDDYKICSAKMLEAYRQLRNALSFRLAEKFSVQLDEDEVDLISSTAAQRPEQVQPLADQVFSLAQSFINGSVFIEIRLTNWEDAFGIFEGLNNRGLELTEKDLIKNMILARAHHDDQLSDEHIQKMDATWTVLTNRIADSRFSYFLRHYLLLTNQSVELKRVVRILKAHVGPKSSTEIIKELDEASRCYQRIAHPSTNSDEALKKAFERFRGFDAERAYPIPLAAGLKGVAGADQIKILDALESLIFRRSSVMNRDNKILEAEIQKIAANLFANGPKAVAEAIEAIVAITPYDEEFTAAFIAREGMKDSVARYMLRRMEEYLRKGPLVVDAKVTLEHIMPKDASLWQLSEAEQALHASTYPRLGNLTLLTGSTNSQIGNKPFSDKLAAYKSNELKINEFVIDQSHWDSTLVKERQVFLAELACKVWPGPPDPTSK